MKIDDILNRRISFCLSSVMFHRNAMVYFEERFGKCDFDWLLKMLENKKSIEIKPCIIRYVHGGNLSLNPEYRRIDFYYSLLTLDRYGDSASSAMKKFCGSRARYHYLMGEMKKARHYFLQSNITLKTIAYMITSYSKYLSNFVKRNFRIFG